MLNGARLQTQLTTAFFPLTSVLRWGLLKREYRLKKSHTVLPPPPPPYFHSWTPLASPPPPVPPSASSQASVFHLKRILLLQSTVQPTRSSPSVPSCACSRLPALPCDTAASLSFTLSDVAPSHLNCLPSPRGVATLSSPLATHEPKSPLTSTTPLLLPVFLFIFLKALIVATLQTLIKLKCFSCDG